MMQIVKFLRHFENVNDPLFVARWIRIEILVKKYP